MLSVVLVFLTICFLLHAISFYEDEVFVQRQLLALVAPKVFFYMTELNGALSYALGAGSLFDVSDDSDYAQTLLGNLPGACIMTSSSKFEDKGVNESHVSFPSI